VSDAVTALRAIYDSAAAEIEARPSLFCEMSGRCCRFKEAGHDLFLTALEYEEMVRHGGTPPGRADGACPWLREGLCDNREGRALACRTYYCSDESGATEVTERGHRRIRELHERYGLEYVYRSLHEHRNSDPRISSEET
jgi:hypothetical protein